MRVNMTFSIPSVATVSKKLGTDERGDVQKKVTDEVFKRIKNYMPISSGELTASKTRVVSPTMIKVDGPYARRQFFGRRKDGSPYRYNRNANPKAGPHWDRRMLADEGVQLREEVQRYIDRKAKK